MRLFPVLSVGLYLASATALAAQGEVCLSKPTPAPATTPFDNVTVFQCKTAGKLTVSQLYEKGWRIVSVFPQANMSAGGMDAVWTVVIEKP